MVMEQERIDYLQKIIDQIDIIENQKSDKLTQWIKLIITILVALLSILVAFKTNKPESYANNLLFASILSLLGIAVISGLVFLFQQIDEFKQALKFQRESLKKRFEGDITSSFGMEINKRIVFRIAEYVFYISSVFMIILLVIYGILK